MKNLFLNLKLILIIIPAIATIFISNIADVSYYIFSVLLLLFIVVFRWVGMIPTKYYIFLILIEAAAVIWICYQYKGITYLLAYSILISVWEELNIKHKHTYSLLILIVMDFLFLSEGVLTLFMMNFIFIIFSFLFSSHTFTKEKQDELTIIYDQLRKKHYELEEAKKQVDNFAKQIEKYAQNEERERISRQLHDDFGHQLIRLKMMMEAAVQVYDTDQEQARTIVVKVRDQLTDSMKSLQQTVRKMHDTTTNQYELRTLIDEFVQDCGVHVQYDMQGIPYELYPSEEMILYNNVKEAMTNAVKHGNATEITVSLQYEQHAFTFSISNNGVLPTSIKRKGLGLLNMEERVKLLNGEVSYSMQYPFTVICRLTRNVREEHEHIERTT
ncbi:sensor histidine kinase [Longirhabdus pacifica]|uniref:sensor histidine kinase n=1 Tax=Longirhabdus pacifica TaxID=2305227 RepID=UPI0010091A5A|nr:sensor histidine kinase [Longirhabdus pacifica]